MRWFPLLLSASLLATAAAACSSKTFEPSAAAQTAVGGFPGCVGAFNRQPSPTGKYYATDFGCSSNPSFNDPGDTCGSAACIRSAFDQGICSNGQSNASCQRTVNWYSIGGARYGCGTRLQVSNPANGKSAVVMVLDEGPSCRVENNAGFWVLDVSYPTIMHLFGSQEGYSDHALVQAVVVDPSTPLGPNDGSASPPTPPPPPPPPPSPPSTPEAGVASSPDGGTPCNTDGDCNPGSDGSGQICTAGFCVPGCNTDAECPGSTTCVAGQCQ